jgi:hypothetical protein
MATATKRAMTTATATTVVGNEESNDNCGKSNGDGNEGGWRATATRAIATRVAGK